MENYSKEADDMVYSLGLLEVKAACTQGMMAGRDYKELRILGEVERSKDTMVSKDSYD